MIILIIVIKIVVIFSRFIMLRGSSGFYSYAIYEHLEDMPSLNLNETRMAFMLKKEKYIFDLQILNKI